MSSSWLDFTRNNCLRTSLDRRWVDGAHRALANNSAVYADKPSAQVFLEEWTALVKSGSGERGIFSRAAAQKQVGSTNGTHVTHVTQPRDASWRQMVAMIFPYHTRTHRQREE